MNDVVASSQIGLDMDKLRGRQKDIFFYGLLIYTVMFYSQFAARLSFLAPLRLELVLGSILVVAALGRLASGKVKFGENSLNLAALLFISAAMISGVFALVKSRALNEFIHFIKFFAIYLMIIVSITDERKLKVFLYVYLSMITLLFIEPFFLSLVGKGFIYNNHMLRLAGTTNYFGHPNQLGGITAENLTFFFYLMKQDKSKTRKVLYILLMIVALRVVMLTQSRTAFLGVLSLGMSLWLFSSKKLLSAFVIVTACLTIWIAAPQETKDRFMTMANLNKVITVEELDEDTARSLGSMASRQELIRRGLLTFIEYPILGVGLDNFISYNGRRWGHWFPPHNTYIQAMAEMGIIGFTIFFFVVALTFRNIRQAAKLLRERGEGSSFLGHMSLALTVYLMIRIVVSFFGQDLYENYWWFAGGLSVVILRIAKSAAEEKREATVS